MFTWGFLCEEVFAETLTAPVIVSAVSPQEVFVGRVTADCIRSFRLRHTTTTTAEANSMSNIFTQCRGALLPFTFVNPNDGRPYLVRFDSSLRLELFQADRLRTNELRFVVVTS